MIVDSSATTGRRPASAAATSSDKSTSAFAAMCLALVTGAFKRREPGPLISFRRRGSNRAIGARRKVLYARRGSANVTSLRSGAAMDERKPDHLKPVPSSLRSAIRRARVDSAEQSQAVAELREAELVRLELLLEAIRPVLDQAPEGVELFDPGIAHGERPRLFLDMISFIDLGHDRRTYRFFQDTRHGRVLIAESPLIERIVAATTNYIARRLVEREQALASDWRSREAPPSGAKSVLRPAQAAGEARGKAGRSPPPP